MGAPSGGCYDCSVPPRDAANSNLTVPARPIRLINPIKYYDWGSVAAIPELIGKAPDGTPHAELWLGAHVSDPSLARVTGGELALNALIRSDPNGALGPRIADEYGPRLPYLLKVLAAARALSLQVHPHAAASREGFNRENAAGIPLGHPERLFRDDQQKPELLVALTPFEILAGFRSPRPILAILDGLDGDLVAAVRKNLAVANSEAALREAFRTLLAARGVASCQADITRTIASISARLDAGTSPDAAADEVALRLAEQHPGDPGSIASLLMNHKILEPGESLYVPPAEVHAYLSGVGIEIMTSSDNVLRAGLTHKVVDPDALAQHASFLPRPPATAHVTTSHEVPATSSYRVPTPEFALTIAELAGTVATLPAEGPRMLLCLSGTLDLHCSRTTTTLRQGEAVFVPHAAGDLSVSGDGRLVCAWVP